jgi:two-component system LytT family sensor kinase
VENAIRHGVGQRATFGVIRIVARRAGDALHVTVSDDGPGFAANQKTAGLGLGLANTRARLKQLYGESAAVRVGGAPGGGAEVTMVLPYHPVQPE